ncbi:hypothetical protein SBOR_5479 [Sclerotinia borealis F-4128]|uniref:Uncharacterized protein n=1 Tax=Sclerotinia borealis (strain F-4128) TaxID=1432307 RepID=W9CHU4_SCLBF|nr:hypothetical protein SBOR_5479 [Sclerotinia borealis F-4128]
MSNTSIPNFSRPLSPNPSPPKAPTRPPPPPPMSDSAASNTAISMPVLRSGIEIDSTASNDRINQSESDNGGMDGSEDIHSSARRSTDPSSISDTAQPRGYLNISSSPTTLVRKPRIEMRPNHPLPRSATCPDLSSAAPSISEQYEYTPNRDGAISRADRYSRIIDAAIASSPPLPPSIAGPSRPSGLRNVIFPEDTHENDEITPSVSSTASYSRVPRFAHHLKLGGARHGMQKAFSSMKPASAIGLRLPKNPASSALSGSNFSAGVKLIDIGAPMGVIKKTPEEIQEMLREMGVKSEDLPSGGGSSSKGRAAAAEGVETAVLGAVDEGGEGLSEVQKGRRPARSDSLGASSTVTSTDTQPAVQTPPLTANQLGKLPARSVSQTQSIFSTTNESTATIKPAQEKPKGWYATASLDEIRETLPPVKPEDLIPPEQIPGFLNELLRDFELLKNVGVLKDEVFDQEMQGLTEMAFGTNEESEGEGEGEDDDEDEDEEENDGDDYEQEDKFIWGQDGEPDPNYVDGGWCQEEISSAGVGQRWFQFDLTENILGGPKCPLTHTDPEEEVEDQGMVGAEQHVGAETQHVDETAQAEAERHVGAEIQHLDEPAAAEAADAEEARVEETTTTGTVQTEVEDRFADPEEDFDDDARPLTQVDIWEREGLL